MRLIEINATTSELSLTEFSERNIPAYAILSHVWEDEEVIFSDVPLASVQATGKRGYQKIVAFCETARQKGLYYAWIDTCCIDKSSTTELGEAINSMYKWYANATVCITYLADYDRSTGSLEQALWFRRGWTLQELIAPHEVEFYDRSWKCFGTKLQLKSRLSMITGIDEKVLAGADPKSYSIAQRMSWAAGRDTTRIEDRAYSLLGLFDVNLPMIYGMSSNHNAFIVLQEEIIKYSDDQSIFAWSEGFSGSGPGHCGLLASSPDAFAGCSDVIRSPTSHLNPEGYRHTNVGIVLMMPTERYDMHVYNAVLDCTSKFDQSSRYGILVECLEESGQYARVKSGDIARLIVNTKSDRRFKQRICVRQNPGLPMKHKIRHGFRVHFHLPAYYPHQAEKNMRVLSRAKSERQPSKGILVESFPGATGTVGVIQMPDVDCGLRYGKSMNLRQLDIIKLGFDYDNNPVCSFSSCATKLKPNTFCNKSTKFHQSLAPRNSDKVHRLDVGTAALLDDAWIYAKERPSGKRHSGLPITQAAFRYNGVKRGHVELRTHSIDIDFQLQPYPLRTEKDTPIQGASSSLIWTLDISFVESFGIGGHDEAVTLGLLQPCTGTLLDRFARSAGFVQEFPTT